MKIGKVSRKRQPARRAQYKLIANFLAMLINGSESIPCHLSDKHNTAAWKITFYVPEPEAGNLITQSTMLLCPTCAYKAMLYHINNETTIAESLPEAINGPLLFITDILTGETGILSGLSVNPTDEQILLALHCKDTIYTHPKK